MNDLAADYALLIARLCLSAVFLYSAVDKLVNWRDGLAEVSTLQLPLPQLCLALTIAVQAIGAATVLLGLQARLGALLLIGFTAAATLMAHPFWRRNGAGFRRAFTVSLEHLAIIGGFVMVAAFGSGAFSLERLLAPR
jgi:putative oxidoreductase